MLGFSWIEQMITSCLQILFIVCILRIIKKGKNSRVKIWFSWFNNLKNLPLEVWLYFEVGYEIDVKKLSKFLGLYECGIFNFGLSHAIGFYRKKFNKIVKNLTFILVLRILWYIANEI